jgi:hypothetical protein
LSECLECVFDNFGFGILLYSEEVARVGCSMTNPGEEEAGNRVLCENWDERANMDMRHG